MPMSARFLIKPILLCGGFSSLLSGVAGRLTLEKMKGNKSDYAEKFQITRAIEDGWKPRGQTPAEGQRWVAVSMAVGKAPNFRHIGAWDDNCPFSCTNWAHCEVLCRDNAGCRAWTFDKENLMCYTFSDVNWARDFAIKDKLTRRAPHQLQYDPENWISGHKYEEKAENRGEQTNKLRKGTFGSKEFRLGTDYVVFQAKKEDARLINGMSGPGESNSMFKHMLEVEKYHYKPDETCESRTDWTTTHVQKIAPPAGDAGCAIS